MKLENLRKVSILPVGRVYSDMIDENFVYHPHHVTPLQVLKLLCNISYFFWIGRGIIFYSIQMKEILVFSFFSELEKGSFSLNLFLFLFSTFFWIRKGTLFIFNIIIELKGLQFRFFIFFWMLRLFCFKNFNLKVLVFKFLKF